MDRFAMLIGAIDDLRECEANSATAEKVVAESKFDHPERPSLYRKRELAHATVALARKHVVREAWKLFESELREIVDADAKRRADEESVRGR